MPVPALRALRVVTCVCALVGTAALAAAQAPARPEPKPLAQYHQESWQTRDGLPSKIRVIRPLEPGGLDDEAVAAVAERRFEPGRVSGVPFDVMVTLVVGLWIR